MRTLLFSLLTLGLVAGLMGCEEPAKRPATTGAATATSATKTSATTASATTTVTPTKTTATKTTTTTSSTVSTTTTTARAVAPKGPSVPPVAGKAVEGKLAIRVDCGAGAEYTDKNSVKWAADQSYSAARKWGYQPGSIAGNFGSHPIDALDALYGTERWGMTDYRFDVPEGKYTVRLHFAEIYDLINAPGVRVFNVTLQGKPALEKFDITKAAGGFGKVVVKEFKDVVVAADGKLMIGFEKIAEYPTIQAIEVLQQ